MECFFRPRGVAVVGATPNPKKGGNAIVRNLMLGYRGKVFPVNPKYKEIEGLPCYPRVSAVGEPVDLAIVFTPATQVPEAVDDCAACGVKGVIIETGGFAETGKEGAKLQQRIIETAKKTGIRVWGPNCMGLVDAVSGHVFSFMDPTSVRSGLMPGNVSLVVQSGMLSAGFLIDIVSHGVMGISKVCSIGNKIDVNECDLLPALFDDPDTAAVGMYLESLPEGRRFARICREGGKPVVVLKSGKSSKGAQAAMSHTASMASNHRVVEGVLSQTGVYEARDFKQMMDLCRSLAQYPTRPKGPGRIAVLTFSGGAGIVSADFLEEYGLATAELSPTCREDLRKLFPSWMPVGNPVDIWPAIEKHMDQDVDVYDSSLKSILDDPGVDAALLLVLAGSRRITVKMQDLAVLTKKTGKPIFVWVIGGREAAHVMFEEARKYGVLAFQELSRAVECLAAVFRERHAGSAEISAVPAPPLERISAAPAGPMDEQEARALLRDRGIPVVQEGMVRSAEACRDVAGKIGYPVALKGMAPGVTHKTERGLVRLHIGDPDAAAVVFNELMQAMNGKGAVSVQQQVKGPVEIIVGMLRDAQFGACVMVGLGGVMAEAFQDAAFAMAPLTHREALRLIGRIKGQRLLDGFRGMPKVDRDELAAIIVAIGALGAENDRISEIDINPLMATEKGLVAVDAVIVIR